MPSTRRRSRTALGLVAALAASIGFAGCSEAEAPRSGNAAPTESGEARRLAAEPLANELTARCGEAMLGGGAGGWRRASATAGAFGFFGDGRGFADPGPDFGAPNGVKLPAVVAGDGRVVVSIAPRDRSRAALKYGFTGRRTAQAVRRMAFEPCRDRPVTSWPGELRISDKSKPIVVRVEVEGETASRRLVVGHISPG